jgi:hypothetical protein
LVNRYRTAIEFSQYQSRQRQFFDVKRLENPLVSETRFAKMIGNVKSIKSTERYQRSGKRLQEFKDSVNEKTQLWKTQSVKTPPFNVIDWLTERRPTSHHGWQELFLVPSVSSNTFEFVNMQHAILGNDIERSVLKSPNPEQRLVKKLSSLTMPGETFNGR